MLTVLKGRQLIDDHGALEVSQVSAVKVSADDKREWTVAVKLPIRHAQRR